MFAASLEETSGHVTVRTFLRFFGIVEGQCALMRNTAGLPLAVVVKAAKPAEVVDRLIEMHLVTGRTKLCRVLTMERLEETLFMRFGGQGESDSCGVFG